MYKNFLKFVIIGLLSFCTNFCDAAVTAEIPLVGKHLWEKYIDIDNTNQDVTVTKYTKTVRSLKTDYEELKKSVIEVGASLVTGVDFTLGFSMINVRIFVQVKIDVTIAYENTVKQGISETQTFTDEEWLTVNPGAHLIFYRKVFVAPGVYYETDARSTSPQPEEQFQVNITVQQ